MTISKKLLLGILAVGMASVAPLKAQLSITPGDLLLNFYTSNGTSVGANTYTFDLGAGATWRENTVKNYGIIANIGTDLTTAFGAGWADNAALQVGIIGGYASGQTGTGDPTRTIYVSQALSSFAPGTSTAPVSSIGNHNGWATDVGGFSGGVNGAAANGATQGGSIIASTAPINYTAYVPPTAGTFFSTGINPDTSFTAGNLGTGTGGYTVEAALDVYRVLKTTSGADLTAGLSAGNAAAYNGQYIGTFTVDNAGNVRLDAVPEPSTVAMLGLASLAVAGFAIRRRKQTNN